MPAPQSNQNSRWSDVKHDFLASIVVFLVALPLCMGVAIASGAPVASGLLTGIVGGLVVGALSGCPLQVSGPAAGLTVIVYETIESLGLEMLGIVVLLTGTFQLLAGIFGLGQWFRAVSPAVIKGMLAGIGILILASQFHVMVDDKPKGSGLQNLWTIPEAIWKGLVWDDLGPKADRAARTRNLHEIGELHRKQLALAARVSECVPDHASSDLLEAEAQATIKAAAKAIGVYVPIQQTILESLQSKVNEFKLTNAPVSPDKRSERIAIAVRDSISKLDQARNDLEQGNVRQSMRSQQAAVASLERLNNRLKNHGFAAQLGMLTILVILLWQGLAPKKLAFLPGPLLAIVLVTIIAAAFTIPVLHVQVPDRLWEEIRFPTRAVLYDAPWRDVLQAALVIAIVASAETLLCATALDQMHQGARTKYDQELRAQGVGNMVNGFLGALPMTGVIVRSTANIQAGGKSRLSAILHGMWLLLFVAFLSSLLRMIPTSSLAAILVYTGYKLVDIKSIRTLWRYGWGEVAVYAATVLTIVCTDLLTGVIVGVTLTAAKLLYTFSHLITQLSVNIDGRRYVLKLRGCATFLRLPQLAAVLERVPGDVELHVDFEHLDYIDHACLDLLMNWTRQQESTGGGLVLDWESLHARFRPEQGIRVQNTVNRKERLEIETPKSTQNVEASR
jgi:MFS superfamily sulfate permease-like transporter